MKLRSYLIPLLLLLILKPCYGSNGIRFTQNKGQWEHPFLYKANIGSGALFVEKTSFTYNFYNADKYHFHHFDNSEKVEKLKWHAFRINFIGANDDVDLTHKNPFPEHYNYYLGSNPDTWKSSVKAYQLVHYQNLYQYIDLSLYSLGNRLKYDVIVNPGGKVNDIQLEYEGHDKLSIDKEGNLHITTSINEIIEQKPYAYQVIDGNNVEIPCAFVLVKNRLSFKMLEAYDKSRPLIIDPVLIFGSYSASVADNFGMTATYGYDGSLYAGGTAFNIGYPTTLGAFDASFNGVFAQGITDVVITRYDSTGANHIYSTYIGGVEAETVHSIIANENDELFIYGCTSSSDFPVLSNGYDTTFNGGTLLQFVNNGTFFNMGTDIYVAKFNGMGTALLGSTYVGGSSNDGVNHSNVFQLIGGTLSPAYDSLQNNYSDQYRGEIMLDQNNNCYISSSSRSADFPIVNGFDNVLDGPQDGVILKFNNDLSTLMWSTYIGGSDMDAGYGIRVDTSENVYVSGGTTSNDFPATAGTINMGYQGGDADGFLAKINSTGTAILAATYIGTSDYDQCYFIDIDRFGSIYTLGQTRGLYPVFNAAYSDPNSGQFIAKFNNTLDTTIYSTVFGNGNVNTYFTPSAFLVDRCQNVYVSGWGGNLFGVGGPMTNMPITVNSIVSAAGDNIPTTSGDGYNFYLTVLERDMKSQLFGIYYGGGTSQEHVDGGTSRFDKNGIVYQSVCAGCWGNSDFPTTTGAYSQLNQASLAQGNTFNGCNNGVFKFDFEIIPVAEFTVDKFEGCAPLSVTFSNSSNATDYYLWDFGGGDTTSQIFNPVKVYNTPGTYNVTLLITDSICNTVDSAFQIITVNPPITVSGGDTTLTCDTITLSVSTTGGPTTFIWSSNNQFSDTLNSNLADSNYLASVNDTTWFFVMATNGPCSVIDSFLVYFGVQIEAIGGVICDGMQDTLGVINLSNQTLTYSWSPVGSIISGANTANPIVNPSTTTTYVLTAQNIFGCTVTDTVVVVVSTFNSNSINVTADQDTLYGGDGTYLHVIPNTGFNYLWSPSLFLDNPISSDPFASPLITTTYTVDLLEIATGCLFTRTYTLYSFELNCDEPDLFMPNAFTPNQDNENDVLYVRGRNIEKMILKIYDRWGELVFETSNQNIGWDGSYKDKLVDPGVFVYYLEITCLDGQEYFKKGNVTVIR